MFVALDVRQAAEGVRQPSAPPSECGSQAVGGPVNGRRLHPQGADGAASGPARWIRIVFMRRDYRLQDHRPSTPLPSSLLDAVRDGRPFAASEALQAGLVTRYALRSRFRMLVPGVYCARGSQLTKWDRIRAVGMWSPADAVISGWAAAYLHGERWFSRDASRSVIDVYTAVEPRMPPGVRERRLRHPIQPEDICEIGGLRVTAPARTAVDVARWTHRADSSICMVDSVCQATRTSVEAVAGAAARMRGQHGVRRVIRLLDSCDASAQG